MAVMARTLGIPARVVVGFTGGTKQSDGSYLVTGADAHAWPQLWFDGAGWVRFEPTPASGSPGVAAPPYAAPDRAESLPRASPAPAPPQSAPIPTTEPGTASDSSAPGGPPIALLLGLVLCALVAALLALPGAARRRVRRSRLERAARGDAAAAWQEVGASAVDAGLSWDASATIRRQAEGVRSALGSDSGVAAVAAAAESARYGRGATPRSTERGVRSLVVLDEPSIDGEAALADDLHDVVAALDALPRTLAARLLPRSMRRRRFRRS
jgi:hypothetical protein